MQSILNNIQSIPKPAFLSQPRIPTRQNEETKHPNVSEMKPTPGAKSNTNPFLHLTNISNKSLKSDLPNISFTDFAQWDLQPYNDLFIRERLRRRIESNKAEYAKHGIVAQSIPLNLEIKSIQNILISGGTLSELRMSPRSKSLFVISSYSKIKARPITKLISALSDKELTVIIDKYNNLRRTTLIRMPCVLCGIYDLYFLQLCVSIVSKSKIQIIRQKLMQFLSKSLIYCLVKSDNNMLRDTTLDLLNYEALHTLLLCMSNNCDICCQCIQKYKLSLNINVSNKWFCSLLNILMNHGFDLKKVVKNEALQHNMALMNVYNCQWLDMQQILMIFIPFQPFIDKTGYKHGYIERWCVFCNNLRSQYNEMMKECDAMIEEPDKLEKYKRECDNFAFEIQLTVFESFLNAVIDPTHLEKMIDFLYDAIKSNESILSEYDVLMMLLFCGHDNGYKYMFKLLGKMMKNENPFLIFESFDALLSITTLISSNLKDIGKIIAVRSCLFHYKFGQKYFVNHIDAQLMEQSIFEFIQCLKVLFYDYELYDFDADIVERSSQNKTNNERLYTKKLPPSIVDKQQHKEEEKEQKENESEHVINYVDLISMGLKTQKKFLMECPYLNVDILQCLLELKLLDEAFIVDRFKNTYDFVQYEQGINAKLIWNGLQRNVFLYNKNVCIFRRMKIKDLRLLFRSIVRNAVSKEFKEWIDECNEKDQASVDKKIQIQKRAAMEEKYKMPNKIILMIQTYV